MRSRGGTAAARTRDAPHPRLPVDAVDVLVVDRMGKDISGVGIDPNITGRIGVGGERNAPAPRVGAMMVCDLTDGIARQRHRRGTGRRDYAAPLHGD